MRYAQHAGTCATVGTISGLIRGIGHHGIFVACVIIGFLRLIAILFIICYSISIIIAHIITRNTVNFQARSYQG